MAPPRPPAKAVEKALIVQPSRSLRRRISLVAFIAVCAGCVALAYHSRNVAPSDGSLFQWERAVLPAGLTVAEKAAVPLQVLSDIRGRTEGIFVGAGELSALREEVSRLRALVGEKDMLLAENDRLKALLHFQRSTPHGYVSGRAVSAYDNGQSRRALVRIDPSALDPSKGGYAVVNESGLAGRLVGFEESAGRVMLLNDADSRVPVITSRSSERAILAGFSGPFPRLELLREEHNVRPGETVSTSGDGGTFPPDLPVGTVIDGGDDGLLVVPFAAPSRLRDVSVVIPAAGSLSPRSDIPAAPEGHGADAGTADIQAPFEPQPPPPARTGGEQAHEGGGANHVQSTPEPTKPTDREGDVPPRPEPAQPSTPDPATGNIGQTGAAPSKESGGKEKRTKESAAKPRTSKSETGTDAAPHPASAEATQDNTPDKAPDALPWQTGPRALGAPSEGEAPAGQVIAPHILGASGGGDAGTGQIPAPHILGSSSGGGGFGGSGSEQTPPETPGAEVFVMPPAAVPNAGSASAPFEPTALPAAPAQPVSDSPPPRAVKGFGTGAPIYPEASQ